MKPAPISSAICLTSRRCSFTSSQVWWIVSSGAPDSSSWPPGSRLTFAPFLTRPMMLPASVTGSQPKRSDSPVSIALIEHGPS